MTSVKERRWGAVLRVMTATSVLDFKASGATCRHELPIVADLSERWPTLVPNVIAVDRPRAWLLVADHGTPMRETPVGPLRIDDRDRTAYIAGLPLMAHICAELSATSSPVGLDHADLHAASVLVEGSQRRLIDWGDACITHPFTALFVPYRFVVASLPASSRRTATLRLRDAYLGSWGATAHNRRAVALAVWTAHVVRAVNIAHEAGSDEADQREITSLLHAWHQKRSLLDRPDDLICSA